MRLQRQHLRAQARMTDYSENGAIPVEDAAVSDPPTVDDVMAAQRRDHPEQVRRAATTPVPLPLPVDAPVDGDNGGA